MLLNKAGTYLISAPSALSGKVILHAAKDTYAYRWAKDNGWKVKEK